jgi:hypothetical protein
VKALILVLVLAVAMLSGALYATASPPVSLQLRSLDDRVSILEHERYVADAKIARLCFFMQLASRTVADFPHDFAGRRICGD